MFTGSSRTGKAVMRAAADALVPCYLELGGKDPMIVCADADIERAANAAAFYSMNNGGQVCISVERCYVEEPIYDEFVARVTDNVRALRQGEPTGIGTVDVGAVIFPPQLDIVDEHVRDAVAKGAKVLTGGHPHSERGRYYEPTVLVDVDHSMRLMQEETFGPTLPIMKIANAEEGVRLANDSAYGLQASVWTRDADRGEELARRIEAGVVCVNDAQINYSALNLPMGGWKSSGIGHPARRQRDPQVHQDPVAAGDPPRAVQARAVHVPLQAAPDDAAAALLQAALRTRRPGLVRAEETGMAGACGCCGAPHSMGASHCWQRGQPLLAQLLPDAIATP